MSGFLFPQSQVEYAISVLEVDDIGTQSSQTVLGWATEQIPGLHGFYILNFLFFL